MRSRSVKARPELVFCFAVAVFSRRTHTFCSHLAMRGAPPTAIQELAGHLELRMTQRYVHLSPAALDSAIRLLDQPMAVQTFGDVLETGSASERA